MKKLLSSPVKMSLSSAENQIYQNALKYISPLSLNLMAVKVDNHPNDFLGWCTQLHHLCNNGLNFELIDDEQLLPLKKLQETLEDGASISQLKMARIAPWPIFVGFIQQQSEVHALNERLRLLEYIEKIRTTPLAELSLEDQLAFSGKHTSQHKAHVYNFDVEWFANTKGARAFHTLLSQSPEKFDAALAHIPLTGDVTLSHYQQFVDTYTQIFNDYSVQENSPHKAPLSAATRLLSMRRPDQFIALTNNKIDILCKGLSIPKLKNTDFLSYWQDIIGTLRTFTWWNESEPTKTIVDNNESNELTDTSNQETNEAESVPSVTEEHKTQAQTTEQETTEQQAINATIVNSYCEHTLWKNRAILIDLFLFADPSLVQLSNYIKARDKALNKTSAVNNVKALSRKRTKATAEELVDEALSNDELPEYLLSKRETILKQVKEGKSAEQAISLIRAIFG